MVGASAASVKAEDFAQAVDARLAWLAPEPRSEVEGQFSQADLNTFAALGIKPPGKG